MALRAYPHSANHFVSVPHHGDSQVSVSQRRPARAQSPLDLPRGIP